MLALGVLPRLALRRPGPFLIPPCLPRLTSHFWPPGLNPWKEMGVRQSRGPVPGEPCAPPAPWTARKREESRAFHGYNKSKGEVRAGEIRNFPTLGTGTCQAAAPGSPGLPSSFLPPWPGPRSGTCSSGLGTPPAQRPPGRPTTPPALHPGSRYLKGWVLSLLLMDTESPGMCAGLENEWSGCPAERAEDGW